MTLDEIRRALSLTAPTGAPVEPLARSFVRLFDKDRSLLDKRAHEQSVAHRLAVYLESDPVFAKLHVDCEYNRHGDDPKRLYGLVRSNQGRLVRPDIIVHSRGTDLHNNLAIELKTSMSPRKEDPDDIMNVHAYVSELDYQFAIFIRLETGALPRMERVVWGIRL